jgi:cytochrome c
MALAAALALAAAAFGGETGAAPTGTAEIGRTPSAEELAAWDIAVGPAGEELPPGRGTATQGKAIYHQQCVACHGPSGTEEPMDRLAGGHGSLASDSPVKTVGSYWPYATTVFDYIRRAMPLPTPGSFTNDEVYAVTAYVLFLHGVVGEDDVMDAGILPQIRMPNRDGFVGDPRPDVPYWLLLTQEPAAPPASGSR